MKTKRRFVPKFDTLFLSVNEADRADLTKTEHPLLGWLLTVLQQENADEETLIDVMLEMFSYIDTLDEEYAPQRRKAMIYLVLFILHRRPPDEHKNLITLIDQQTHDMEVETMAQSIIEITKEEGETKGKTKAKREAIIKLLQIRFDNVPETITQKVNRIRSLSRLNSLFEKAATVNTLDDFDG